MFGARLAQLGQASRRPAARRIASLFISAMDDQAFGWLRRHFTEATPVILTTDEERDVWIRGTRPVTAPG